MSATYTCFLVHSFATYFDVLAVEPTLPRYTSLEEKRQAFKFTPYPTLPDGKPAQYPPALAHIPAEDDVAQWKIFNVLGLAQAQVMLQKVTPDEFLGRTREWILSKARAVVGGCPQQGLTIDDVVDYNQHHRKSAVDIARGKNLGHLEDWYSDRRFADQQFSGTNPTTIRLVSDSFLGEFVAAARAGGYDKWADVLTEADPKSLFMQDCSYFREAAGVSDPAGELHNKQPGSNDNWTCCAVSLFRLHEDGKLHPVAICIDYKGSMDKSVTIFNQRMLPTDSTAGEKEDWPWRYAKTCAQVSDWIRHELAVHLTESHLVEEAIIVATNRTIPMEHIVYKILSPHWYKTLSLNAAARASLVPQVIVELIGLTPDQAYSFIRHSFDNFDFQARYVPTDLHGRGFPADEESLEHPRYRNYPYAKNMLLFWNVLRTYVESMLEPHYPDDAAVARDRHIQAWSAEVQTSGHVKTFPTITTRAHLADAITMCIHVASPFHTAVNYLQNFYQSFVPAKPPMLCSPLPTSLTRLLSLAEPDLAAALPLGRQREWLLAAQIPWLLSFRVEPDRSLLNYALSQYRVCRVGGRDAGASEAFYRALCGLARRFYYNSVAQDEGAVPYMVLDPGQTAVSILI